VWRWIVIKKRNRSPQPLKRGDKFFKVPLFKRFKDLQDISLKYDFLNIELMINLEIGIFKFEN
jgi:hypothetical protein